MLSSETFQEAIKVARRAHGHLGALPDVELEAWCQREVSQFVWFSNEQVRAEPSPEAGQSSEGEPVVLRAARLCLGRPPKADRLAAVVALLLRGPVDALGELELARLVAVDPATWRKAVLAHGMPSEWRGVDHFVVSGNHRVAAQVLLGIPVHALRPLEPWRWY